MKFVEYETKTAISKSNLPELDYAVNPYSGCQHRCIYCFAIDFTNMAEARDNWGDVVYVKRNLVEVLHRQIKGMRRGIVGISSVTDAYQPAEAIYQLTRNALSILLENGFRVTVQTKSPLAARDLDIFSRYRKTIDVGVTLTTLDREKALQIETRTPAPASRVRLLERLHGGGVKTWIFIGPIIRGFNDSPDEISEIIEIARETDSRVIYDFYSQYKNSSAFMKREFTHYSDDPEYHNSRKWRGDLERRIGEIAEREGVRINSQKDEWKVARGEGLARIV